MENNLVTLGSDSFSAVLFDLDGVLTATAEVHMRAWAQLFSDYFQQIGAAPYQDSDYFAYIDGKPRYSGVADMLAARNVVLPYGDPTDSETEDTVCGLGNRKNTVFNQILFSEGVQVYPGSVLFLKAVLAAGKKVAVVSSSKNAPAVLEAADLAQYFSVVVDGVVAAAQGLNGKPAPDTFVYAADLLEVKPAAAVVVEDAVSGVTAGSAGKFGIVLGVDRGVGAAALKEAGADFVVEDLAECKVVGPK